MRDSIQSAIAGASMNAGVPIVTDAESNATNRVVWRTSSTPASGARSRLQERASARSAGTLVNAALGESMSPDSGDTKNSTERKVHPRDPNNPNNPNDEAKLPTARPRVASKGSAKHLRPWPGSFTPAPCPVFSEPLPPDADAAAADRIHA